MNENLWINPFFPKPTSVRGKMPYTVTISDLDSVAGNKIVSAHRIPIVDVDGNEGVDISSKVAFVAGTNKVIVSDIWTVSDTKKAGKYRIRVVPSNSDDSIQPEFNIIVEVKP